MWSRTHKKLFIYGLDFSFPVKSQRSTLCTGIPDTGHGLLDELWAGAVRIGELSTSPSFSDVPDTETPFTQQLQKIRAEPSVDCSGELQSSSPLPGFAKTDGNWSGIAWKHHPVHVHGFQFSQFRPISSSCLPTLALCNGDEETH